MYAQVTMVGRVTKDVAVQTNKNTGAAFMRLNLAVNEGFGDHQHTSYYQCYLEEDDALRAEKAGVRKGSLLYLSGQLSVVDVTRKDGTIGTIARVSRAHWDFIPMGKKSDTAADSPASTAQAQPTQTFPVADMDEDDIPF